MTPLLFLPPVADIASIVSGAGDEAPVPDGATTGDAAGETGDFARLMLENGPPPRLPDGSNILSPTGDMSGPPLVCAPPQAGETVPDAVTAPARPGGKSGRDLPPPDMLAKSETEAVPSAGDVPRAPMPVVPAAATATTARGPAPGRMTPPGPAVEQRQAEAVQQLPGVVAAMDVAAMDVPAIDREQPRATPGGAAMATATLFVTAATGAQPGAQSGAPPPSLPSPSGAQTPQVAAEAGGGAAPQAILVPMATGGLTLHIRGDSGPVTAAVRTRDDAVTVDFRVAEAAQAVAIDSGRPQLADQMTRSGFVLAGGSAEVPNGGGGGGTGTGAPGSGSSTGTGNGSGRPPPPWFAATDAHGPGARVITSRREERHVIGYA
jgi:hypothetical protein